MSLHRVGKGWGKTHSREWKGRGETWQTSSRSNSDAQIPFWARRTPSVRSRETAQAPALGDTEELHRQGAATAQLGCSRFSVAEQSGSQVRGRAFSQFGISPPQSQYQPVVNKPNTGTSDTSGRLPIGRSRLLVFMALCCLWGFHGIRAQRTMIRTMMNCLVSQKDFKSQDIRNITFTRPKITKFLTAVS